MGDGVEHVQPRRPACRPEGGQDPEPGRQNVPILGDSTARAALSPGALTDAFADRGLAFSHMVIDGTSSVAFGFLANDLLDLDPSAAIL